MTIRSTLSVCDACGGGEPLDTGQLSDQAPTRTSRIEVVLPAIAATPLEHPPTPTSEVIRPDISATPLPRLTTALCVITSCKYYVPPYVSRSPQNVSATPLALLVAALCGITNRYVQSLCTALRTEQSSV